MKMIARNKRQITLIYNPRSSVGKKTMAYIRQAKLPVLEMDINKVTPTPSQWLEIANDLNMDVKELILKDHPVFTHHPKSDLHTEDWLKIIQQHPEVIAKPIAIRDDKVVLVKTPTDILKIIAQR